MVVDVIVAELRVANRTRKIFMHSGGVVLSICKYR